MAKRLSGKEKEKIINLFLDGKTVNYLSKEFNCTNLTISRNLKKELGENKYKELVATKSSSKELIAKKKKTSTLKQDITNDIKENIQGENYNIQDDKDDEMFSIGHFTEIVPIEYEIDNANQKDLSSVPINEIDFPKNVFMIVHKDIELETKYLRDYPEWQFLSKEELNRKTIQIFDDLKIAKRCCNKEQKVIKVPNTDVFKVAASLLLSKGISRIVGPNLLIALG